MIRHKSKSHTLVNSKVLPVWLKSKWVWCRNRKDFFLYGIKVGKINPYILIVNLLIFAYSLCNLRTIFDGESLWVIILLLFVNVVWQFVSTIYDCYNYAKRTEYYHTGDSKITTDIVLDDNVRREYKVLSVQGTSLILYSDRINAILRGSDPIQLHISKRKKVKVEKYIKTYRDILLPFLNCKWHEVVNNNGLFYNENKLCMASEIERNEDVYAVMVNKGSYYDSFLTNNIYNLRMSHQNGFDIEPPYNAKNYAIHTFDVSLLNNHIGVSTLAVSKDGFTVMLRHNNRSAMFTDKLLPSGSGSMDYSDMKGQSDLRGCVTCAAERELSEETSIKEEMIVSSEVLGFYRDLNRGGKPEFCCLTRLNCNKYELQETIRPDRLEQQDDFQLVKMFECGKLHYKTMEELNSAIDAECSLSLSMNLEMLYKHCESELHL